MKKNAIRAIPLLFAVGLAAVVLLPGLWKLAAVPVCVLIVGGAAAADLAAAEREIDRGAP